MIKLWIHPSQLKWMKNHNNNEISIDLCETATNYVRYSSVMKFFQNIFEQSFYLTIKHGFHWFPSSIDIGIYLNFKWMSSLLFHVHHITIFHPIFERIYIWDVKLFPIFHLKWFGFWIRLNLYNDICSTFVWLVKCIMCECVYFVFTVDYLLFRKQFVLPELKVWYADTVMIYFLLLSLLNVYVFNAMHLIQFEITKFWNRL